MKLISFTALAAFCGLIAARPQPNGVSTQLSRDCSAEIEAFNLERRTRRGIDRRTFYWGINNLTCILSPETPKENYIAGAPIRQDITEGQQGIAFTLDIGVLDITTCKPLPNVMVELWHANAVGDYGQTFLRGAFASADNGIAEFQTIFPGYTSTGAANFNLLVHTGSSISSPVAHTGQVFFTDKWTTIVSLQTPYNQNTHTRVTDLDDSTYMNALNNGYSPIVNVLSIHDDWPEGIIGDITVGVNPHV